jgi:hypothetical protein
LEITCKTGISLYSKEKCLLKIILYTASSVTSVVISCAETFSAKGEPDG